MRLHERILVVLAHFAGNVALGALFYSLKSPHWGFNVVEAAILFYGHFLVSFVLSNDECDHPKTSGCASFCHVLKVLIHLAIVICGFLFFGGGCYTDYGNNNCAKRLQKDSPLSVDILQNLILAAAHHVVEGIFCFCRWLARDDDNRYSRLF